MTYMFMRLLYGAYFLGAIFLMFTVLGRAFGKMENMKDCEKTMKKIFACTLWPFFLFTPSGLKYFTEERK